MTDKACTECRHDECACSCATCEAFAEKVRAGGFEYCRCTVCSTLRARFRTDLHQDGLDRPVYVCGPVWREIP